MFLLRKLSDLRLGNEMAAILLIIKGAQFVSQLINVYQTIFYELVLKSFCTEQSENCGLEKKKAAIRND